MAFLLNTDLKKGFTVSQVTEKHGWPESLVWAVKLDGKDDLGKCHELQWENKSRLKPDRLKAVRKSRLKLVRLKSIRKNLIVFSLNRFRLIQ
ncbi:MAG: hypothetical protein JW927_21035 [Deltaproteobacteria bacterium]|nr:hypothetical protein [Deltaproteobacteria bacterium]